MKSVFACVAQQLYRNGIINSEDIEICTYGLENLFLTLIEIASILIFSIFMNNTFSTVLLLAVFIPLRRYSGGYHSQTRIGCYMTLIMVYVCFTLLLRHMPSQGYTIFSFCSVIITNAVIFPYAPIVHKSKKIHESERIYYKRRSIIITLFFSIIIVFGNLNFGENIHIFSLSIGLMVVSFSMILTIIQKKERGDKTMKKFNKFMKNVIVKYGSAIACCAFAFVAATGNSASMVIFHEPGLIGDVPIFARL